MSYAWVATAMTNGQILEDLPDLAVEDIAVGLCEYQSATADLPIASAPDEWERATLPGATVLNLIDSDNDDTPVYGAFITHRNKSTDDDKIPLSMVTLEGYFNRRFVRDVSYTQVGQNQIVADLVQRYITQGSNGGIPLRIVKVGTDDGPLRDRDYEEALGKSVYSCLTELSDLPDGPEWTIGWERQHNPERITPVLYIGTRVGTAADPVLGTATTFEVPGSAGSVSLDEDYTEGHGANDVTATSTAVGSDQPQSDHIVTVDPLRPTFEDRFTPTTDVTDNATLNDHARARAQRIFGSTKTVAIEAIAEDAPRLGIDWFIGDDIGYYVSPDYENPDSNERTAFPRGADGIRRVIGWQIKFDDVEKIIPVFEEPTDGDT
ncbi:hypothetical protein AS850_02650 [Frondihabitans sp. 762G35]|uniref:hypothetical protein n=1 Tax=Frondihabitans sp. 762G35 TaxID=1446794 RepID=UPI000D2159E9|nr:hypothetical protein [Frondihabitans sp. 762G35]ARC55972.1 hypothetical protein AS850_02650 [Frondihabitans sp. 762G35]